MIDKEQFNQSQLREETKRDSPDSKQVKDPRSRVTLWQRKAEQEEIRNFVYEKKQSDIESAKIDAADVNKEKALSKSEIHPQGYKAKPNPASEHLLNRDNVSDHVRRDILRRNIVQGGSRLSGMTDEEYRKYKQQKTIRRIAIVAAIVIIIITAFSYNYFKKYNSYTITWQETEAAGEDTLYLEFQNNFIKYSKDGISCINRNGETMWSESYTMTTPAVTMSESYIAVYDKQGYTIYICDIDGRIGQVTTTRPITCAVMAEQGVVATSQEDSDTESHYINYYNKDGSKIDVEIKTLLAGNGYPMDIAISPNGQELMASYIYMEEGSMLNQVVFYNFDVGKNESERTVGGFRDYEGSMVPDVAFLGNESAVAFADNRIDFYSLKNALEPSRKESYTFDRDIKSVFYNDSYVGVVLSKDENDEQAAYELTVYNSSGNEVFTKNLDFDYTNISLSGDGLVIYNVNKCMIYNMNGRLKYNGTLTGSIEQVVRLSERIYLVSGNQIVQGITLQ